MCKESIPGPLWRPRGHGGEANVLDVHIRVIFEYFFFVNINFLFMKVLFYEIFSYMLSWILPNIFGKICKSNLISLYSILHL